jgi:hypothetical protein
MTTRLVGFHAASRMTTTPKNVAFARARALFSRLVSKDERIALIFHHQLTNEGAPCARTHMYTAHRTLKHTRHY